MKAIVCTKYGSPDVFQLQEVAEPTLTGLVDTGETDLEFKPKGLSKK